VSLAVDLAYDQTTAEERVVRRAQAGDRDAYGELVRTHQELAFRTAYLITHSAHDAEEAVQEAFIKAHRALRRFRAGEPFRPWILRIVTNEAYTVMRSRTRHRTLAERARDGVARHPESPSAPHASLVAGHEREALLRALAALSERDRQVVICRYVLDLSEAETAAVIGCRRGTVKSRLSRALDRMRAGLEDAR
jgi:RNA polymerase sigma-70 factor (ECF subfamily)